MNSYQYTEDWKARWQWSYLLIKETDQNNTLIKKLDHFLLSHLIKYKFKFGVDALRPSQNFLPCQDISWVEPVLNRG